MAIPYDSAAHAWTGTHILPAARHKDKKERWIKEEEGRGAVIKGID
jgi:hypothetical protein